MAPMVTTITMEPMVAITDHQMVSEMPVVEVEIVTGIPIMYVYSFKCNLRFFGFYPSFNRDFP